MFKSTYLMSFLCLLCCLCSNKKIEAAWPTPPVPFTHTASDSNASVPEIFVDDRGNAVAIWEKALSGIQTIQTSIYTFSSNTWSDVNIISDITKISTDPEVCLNEEGNGAAIWTEEISGNTYIAVSFYTMTTALWSPLSIISPQDSTHPDIGIDSMGNVIAAWIYYNGTNDIVQISRYNKLQNTWSTPLNITAPLGDATDPIVSINSSGNAAIIWSRNDPHFDVIQGVYYSASNDTWSLVTDLSESGQNAFNPALKIDQQGNAFAVWSRFNGSHYIVQANIYSLVSNAWQAINQVTNLSLPGSSVTMPQISTDPNGNAIAVFQKVLDGVNVIESCYYKALNHSWQTSPVNVFTGGFNAGAPQVVMTPNGDASAVFPRFDGNCFVIYASDYNHVESSWSEALIPLSLSSTGNSAASPQTARDPYGNITAIWTKYDGHYNVIQTTTNGHNTPPDDPIIPPDDPITPESILPPTNFWGRISYDEHATHKEIVHTLYWSPSQDPRVVGYKIYQGNKLICTKDTKGRFKVVLRNRYKNAKYILVGIDSLGNESPGINLQL